MAIPKFADRLPQCSRCGGDLIMSGVAPQDDQDGPPIHWEPCPSCDAEDADRPAAGLFVQFFADGAGHDASRTREAAHLLTEWTQEGMTAHGRRLLEMPPDPF
ncbi:DUF6300 family protein [Streptomyces sp. NPDC050388]|uniref:DUF6300 family protein n=1 Tax=Streptomyces sp. NPDC050388 TaxID=3155781 RepID=UPI0034180BEE